MSVLEDRYRAVLRLLPASYRAVWEEEMVATFLESMGTQDAEEEQYLADYGRPSASEVASVAVLALRLRLGGLAAPPRSFACGQAVRVIALVGLLTNALVLPMALSQYLWIAADMPLPTATRAALAVDPPAGTEVTGEVLVGLVWVAAYLAVVAGRRRAAQVLALVALVPSGATAAAATLDLALGHPSPVLTLWCGFLINTLLVLALAAFHRQAPPVRRRPWLIALAVGVALTPIPGVLPLLQPIEHALLDWPGLVCLVWLAAALLHRISPEVPPALAVALLALPVLALRVVSLLDYALTGGDATTLTLGLIEAAAVAGVGLPLLARTLRRLPPVNAPPPRLSSRS